MNERKIMLVQWIRESIHNSLSFFNQDRIKLLYSFATGQGLLQLLNILNSFLLLRWLTVEEQAKFSLAMSLQLTLANIGDLGFGGSLVGLVGARIHDKLLIGKYIKSIQFYKNRLLILSLFLGTILVFIYGKRQGWTLDFWLIYLLIIIGVQAQSIIGYYSAVLQMKKDLSNYYYPQVLSSLGRLIIGFVLFQTGILTALQSVTLITATFVINALLIKKRALIHITPVNKRDRTQGSEILKVLAPVIPLVLFYSLQNQITTLLVSYYGKSQNIAEIGALSRIGQLFALFMPFNAIILMPYFARVENTKIRKLFVVAVLASCLLVAPIIALAYVAPELFLLLLGSKFSSIKSEIGLYVLSASFGYLSNVIWSIQVVRKWTKWYTGVFYIVLTITVQIVCIRNFNLSSTHSVVLLNFYTSCCAILFNVFAALVGLRQTPKMSVPYEVRS